MSRAHLTIALIACASACVPAEASEQSSHTIVVQFDGPTPVRCWRDAFYLRDHDGTLAFESEGRTIRLTQPFATAEAGTLDDAARALGIERERCRHGAYFPPQPGPIRKGEQL